MGRIIILRNHKRLGPMYLGFNMCQTKLVNMQHNICTPITWIKLENRGFSHCLVFFAGLYPYLWSRSLVPVNL